MTDARQLAARSRRLTRGSDSFALWLTDAKRSADYRDRLPTDADRAAAAERRAAHRTALLARVAAEKGVTVARLVADTETARRANAALTNTDTTLAA